jgi:hypothetical protein
LEEAIKLAAAEKMALEASAAEKEEMAKTAAKNGDDDTEICMHGFDATIECALVVDDGLPVVDAFIETFVMAFDMTNKSDFWGLFEAPFAATMEKYSEVWSN